MNEGKQSSKNYSMVNHNYTGYCYYFRNPYYHTVISEHIYKTDYNLVN